MFETGSYRHRSVQQMLDEQESPTIRAPVLKIREQIEHDRRLAELKEAERRRR